MNIANKQIAANRKNALKSTGPKTKQGKAITSRNSLKHGLLAKEIVITAGEGAESQDQFYALLADLKEHFDPQGALEEILVEKIAASYWRLRRAHRFEVGLIRSNLDTATDDFYNDEIFNLKDKSRTDKEINVEIEKETNSIKDWQYSKKVFIKMHKNGKSIEEIYDWVNNWDYLLDKYSYLISGNDNSDFSDPGKIRELLHKKAGFTDDDIWQDHIDLCDERIAHHKKMILFLEKEKKNNHLRFDVQKKLNSIPNGRDLDRLLKYEGSIEKQFYKAINQLERLQRLRKGDAVPPPVNVDLNINKEEIS